jgi:hypothetical protein
MSNKICLNFETFNQLLSLALNNCQLNQLNQPKVIIKQKYEYQEKYNDTVGTIKILFTNTTNDSINIIFNDKEAVIHPNSHKSIKIHPRELPLHFRLNCGAVSSGKNITNENDVFIISGLTKDSQFIIEPIEKNLTNAPNYNDLI